MAALAAKTAHEDRSVYLKKYGSWKFLKSWLAKASYGKCWYCEVKSQRAPMDVDHFRPKLAVTVNGQKIAGSQGYYWLAYEWWNFRLSCQRCNRPEEGDASIVYGKANEFPLKEEGCRCVSSVDDLFSEAPELLDPCDPDDFLLLAHGIDGEVKPSSMPGTWEFSRAEYTVKLLGFNAFNVPEEKRSNWRILDDLIRMAGNLPEVVSHIQERISPDHEYSSFFRAAVGTHRDKAWIEDII
ncbi:hypothetical protein [Shinella sp. M27]|uniref:hypothetical protein n=1 Tax=Shinella sp. M27 TaxID=3368614 RepID=UPI003BA2533D